MSAPSLSSALLAAVMKLSISFLVLKYSCMFMVRIRSAKLLTMHSKLTFDILSVVVR